MDIPIYFRLNSVSVLDIVGADADKILHNLTTNDVAALENAQGCESFVTDVRGKTLGHVVVFRTANSLRLIGASGQSEGLSAHADRYTIREEAEPQIRDQDYVAVVVPPESIEASGLEIAVADVAGRLGSAPIHCGQIVATGYQTDWLGEGTLLMLASVDDGAAVEDLLGNRGLRGGDESEFHRRRTLHGYPWYGVDIDDSNLPQEADRNESAISFTKGCYLGQETVARLDALGQVQKKLVVWSIDGACPGVGATLTADDKKVGRLTSVAASDTGGVLAIGMARRSHFDAGSTAEGIAPESGESFIGTVQ